MELHEAFVGKNLHDISVPAAVADRAVVRRNCLQMLQACDALDVDFRPHVKTHKTIEVARLQVGEPWRHTVKVVVSTLAEAEHLFPFLLECQDHGKSVNVLYGLPIPPSTVRRLAEFGKRFLSGSVSVLVDHCEQLQHLKLFNEITGYPLCVFIKVDTGYHRAGVTPSSAEFLNLVTRILDGGKNSMNIEFGGLYSHAGHSYGGSSASQAMDLLIEEIESLRKASEIVKNLHTKIALTLSVGATPTATSVQNLMELSDGPQAPGVKQSDALKDCIRQAKANHDQVELHAGVYPFLDMQQLATQASPSASQPSTGPGLSFGDIAFTILTEVASLYSERDQPEALIAAGSFALGREPCKSYSGWGIVSNWGFDSTIPTGRSGWQVGRISQEHGILTHESSKHGDTPELCVGQKVRIFPNHACVAGAAFDYYLVVDSNLPEKRRDEILEVWVRCRGW
ncbi:MAG: hypothetical protein LQ349_007168 [Xanthoria aureola]|nr:MAG: hypothetical protein LQ349_007168 [Xanthoria aureola]